MIFLNGVNDSFNHINGGWFRFVVMDVIFGTIWRKSLTTKVAPSRISWLLNFPYGFEELDHQYEEDSLKHKI